MKLLLILFAALFFAPTYLQAQTKLPRAYSFRKEAASKYGRVYLIEPTKNVGTTEWQSLSATVMPDLDRAGCFLSTCKRSAR